MLFGLSAAAVVLPGHQFEKVISCSEGTKPLSSSSRIMQFYVELLGDFGE